MADQDYNQEKKKIPVFTVIKNGSILKNIFLLDNPNVGDNGRRKIQETEETLVVGRHPDCNITLEHPSISRYHLRIHSNPSSQTLYVLDLSSVHGTWVSGRRIEPGVLVELGEGDTVRLGGSSRVYELHWVPLNCAYDLRHPFLPPLDKSNDSEDETHQDENGSYADNIERQLPEADLEGLELSLLKDNHEMSLVKSSLLTPIVSEGLDSKICDEGKIENEILKSNDGKGDQTSSYEQLESALALFETQNQLPLIGKTNESKQPYFCPGITSGIGNVESPCKTEEFSNFTNVLSKRDEVASSHIRPVDVVADIESQNYDTETEIFSTSLIVSPDGDGEIIAPDTEKMMQNTYLVQSLNKKDSPEEIKLSNSYRLSPLRDTVSPSDNDEKKIVKHESVSKTLFSSAETNEDVFTPDKENISPKTPLMRNINKIDKSEIIKHLESGIISSSNNIFGSDISQEENLFLASERGTQTPEILQELKLEKGPSQNKENSVSKKTKKSLTSNTRSNSSILGVSSRSYSSVNYDQVLDHQKISGRVNKTWMMVVDTKCLLHRESLKALQLLESVKGTQLIIPRIVIKELEQMKLQEDSLFRRTTEVSLALQWIENCLVNAKSWIHVQNSVDDGMILARFTDEWGGSHILECALFFRRNMGDDRRIVLLSKDISLKIKSMAEGILCETAEEFRRSLVNPFSDRFLWAKSSPRGSTWSCKDDIFLKERYYPILKSQSLKGLKLIKLLRS